MTDVPHKLQRIALCHESEHRFLLRAICREMKRRFNSEIHIYCALKQQMSFYEEDLRDGTIASVQYANFPPEVGAGHRNEAEVYERARQHEKILRTTFNRLIMANRHLGRGYSLGGYYHPRSHLSEINDYCAIVESYNRQIEFWQMEFDAHDFTMVMFASIELSYVAESRGVEQRSFMEAGLRNLYAWTTDRYDGSRELELAFEHTLADQPADIYGTYGQNDALMAKINEDVKILPMIKTMIMHVIRQAYWQLRGYDKAKSYFVRERLMAAYRLNKQMREVKRLGNVRLEDMAGQQFVFYPLHEEPETVLMIGSPERFDQLGAIASISRDLSAGVKLVIKETYFGVGRRPENFYRQIVDFKNVIFMDMTERGVEIARRADAVVTIRGTVGQEAAILGKPVILLARNAPYQCVPHVRPSYREEDLRPAIEWALSKSFDRRRAQSDGARFYKALVSICVDMGDYNYLEPELFPEAAPAQAIDALVRSVAVDVANKERTHTRLSMAEV